MIYTVTLNPALDRELTVPEILFDSVLRASEVRLDWGGKGFNVSRMLATLGLDSIVLGFVGGRTGAMLQEGLESLGIATEFIQVAGETRTNISIVTTDHRHHLKVNESGPVVTTAEQLALVRQIQARVRPGDWWVLAGSLPKGVSSTFYATLIAEIQNRDGRVILDTSEEALRLGCQARPYMIKPNALELAQLTGLPVNSPAQALQAARLLKGIQYVAVSLGSEGAVLLQGQYGWYAAAPAIEERNPIGAGDSMLAGLLWGLYSNGAVPAEALRWGIACGAATAAKNGTELGSYTEVERLAALIKVQEGVSQ